MMLKRAYVEITSVCNLRCSFCPGTGREARFLSPEEFRLLARRLRPHAAYLYFHVMGEPLLHPELGTLLEIAAELGFRVCLTTNGTRCSPPRRCTSSASPSTAPRAADCRICRAIWRPCGTLHGPPPPAG